MKVKMTRTLLYGNETLAEGQVIEVEDGKWWMDKGFAVPLEPYDKPYETKPHPARPMLAGGEGEQSPSSPPAPRRRGRPPKQSKDSPRS